MGYDDNTLIYIEENDKIEASIAAKGFADDEVKNRAYINALGAELALKYLTSENINVSNIYNMHSIKKVLEETDISDIMLPNIHIDVRVVFDDNYIFIPKAHFEYNLVPDIYLVFNLAKDVTHVKFLGFFEPKLINKNNENDKYYFIEKEKLNPPIDLKNYIQNYKGNTINSLSESEMENSEKIMISMVDNDISEDDKKYLLQQLTKSADLRDKFIEYENFELLSFTAINDDTVQKREIKDSLETAIAAGGFEDLADLSDLNDLSDISEPEKQEIVQDSIGDLPLENEILPSDNTDFMTSDLEDIPDIDDILSDNEIKENAELQNANLEEIVNNDDSNILSDAAILGTAAALRAGASAAETVSGITDGIEIAKDSLDLIYSGLDLENNQNQNNNIDEIQEPENILIEDETISLQSETADLTKEFIEESDTSFDIGNELPDLGTSDRLSVEEKNIAESFDFDNIETSYFEEVNAPAEEIEPETLSIDDVDTSNFEEIELPQEEIAEEVISIDNIDTSEVENNTVDFINEIDNKISFDDIDMQNSNMDEPADFATDDSMDTMSFNNIDTTEMDNIQVDENLIENEKLSFDDVDTSSLQMPEIEIDDDKIDNTISFDDVETDEEDVIETIQDEQIIDNDFLDDSMSFEDDDLEKIDTLNEIEPINEEHLENIDNIVSEKPESFGKNLLDGLASENLNDDISIESIDTELDLPETDNLPNAEDISSSDLLAEIDDILSTTQTNENIGIPDDDIPDTPIEDILGVNSLDEIIPEANTQAQPIKEEVQSFDVITSLDAGMPEQTQNIDEDIVSLIDNVETNYINDMPENDLTSNVETDENQEKLGVLFNDNDSDDDSEYDDDIASLADFEQEAMQENPEAFASVPGVALYKKPAGLNPQNKKIIVAAALVAVLASVSVLAMLKSKSGNADIENLPTSGETEVVDNTPLMPTEEVTSKSIDEPNVLTNAPDINSIDKKEVQKAKSTKELKNTAAAPKTKPISSESYLSVQKLVWDVPDYLSYSPKMKNYLMTAGKSIKLSLSADLLLATEYAYSNQIKVNLKLGNDGAVQDAKVVTSSGSDQIDKIVLQSVKDTLNVVKPPSGEVKGPNFNLSLIIYL